MCDSWMTCCVYLRLCAYLSLSKCAHSKIQNIFPTPPFNSIQFRFPYLPLDQLNLASNFSSYLRRHSYFDLLPVCPTFPRVSICPRLPKSCSGGAFKGSRRIRQRPYGYALPRPSNLIAFRHGIHSGLRGVPRVGDDRQGVHAVRDGGGRRVVSRIGAHVLLGQGVERQRRGKKEKGRRSHEEDGRRNDQGRGGDGEAKDRGGKRENSRQRPENRHRYARHESNARLEKVARRRIRRDAQKDSLQIWIMMETLL